MSRPKNHAALVSAAVENLLKAVTRLVATAGAAVAATGPVAISTVEVKQSAADVKAAAKAKSAKLRKAMKAYWKRVGKKGRTARGARIRAGHARRKRAGAR